MKYAMVVLLTVILVLSPLAVSASTGFTQKDETVYAVLQHDGTQGQLRVVNRLSGVSPGQVTDQGQYLSVRAMQQPLEAELTGGEVLWQIPEGFGSNFWYEGMMEKPLPVTVKAIWTKDGIVQEAERLAGVSGKIGLTLLVSPNPDATEAERTAYMTQVQFSFSRPEVLLTDAGGATVTATGSLDMLAWSILPGETATLNVYVEASSFDISSIDLALIRYELPVSAQLDDLQDGVAQLRDGAIELSEGGDALYTGTVKLSDGIAELASGMSDLSLGIRKYALGMRGYDVGMADWGAGLTETTAGLSGLRDAMVALGQQSAQLLAGQQAQLDGLKQFSDGHDALTVLAQSLIADSNPLVAQLAGGVIAEKNALSQIILGMEQSLGGLNQFMSGFAQSADGLDLLVSGTGSLTQGYAVLHAGYRQLVDGAFSLSQGAVKTASGGEILKTEAVSLPSGTKKLSEGQKDLSKGLNELSSELKGFLNESAAPLAVLSFADGQTVIHSVQFILRIPEITPIEIKKPDGPRDIQLPWYEELWNRLIDLFS